MKKSLWKDIKEAGMILAAFVLIHTQICAQAVIPSKSMVPTLNVDDRLIINKLATKYKTPERGDIVVFIKEDRLIRDEYWIKRVIALPNEVIDLRGGQVYIDDIPLAEDYTIGVTEAISSNITFPYQVPEGHYFLMGDNRQGSTDSRVLGAIEEEDIVAIGGVKIYPFTDIGALE